MKMVETFQKIRSATHGNLGVMIVTTGLWTLAGNLTTPFLALYVLELGGSYVNICEIFALSAVIKVIPGFLGGYLAGAAAGALCFLLRCVTPLPEQLGVVLDFPVVVFGAVAVATATFAMVVTNTEHPPAAGLSLGLAMLDEWRWLTFVAILAGVVALCFVRVLLKPVLRDLL